MKKKTIFAALVVSVLALAGCANDTSEETSSSIYEDITVDSEKNTNNQDTSVQEASEKETTTEGQAEKSSDAGAEAKTQSDSQAQNGSSKETENKAQVDASGVGITYEIKQAAQGGYNGQPYEYPVFTSDKYSTAIASINKEYEDYATDDVAAGECAQSVSNVSIDEDAKFIYISINRTQELGGPHPNNYFESFVINKDTKNFAKLADVVTIDDKLIKDITDGVYEDHTDKDYDTMKADIEKAIKNDKAGWRIEGNNLVIWFDYDDITGAYSGEGEFAAVVPIK